MQSKDSESHGDGAEWADQSREPDRDQRSLISDQPETGEERHFRGWRLLGVVAIVVVVLAVISAVVDWLVIGPLEGRAPWL